MDGFPKENWKRQSLLRDVLVLTISETLARIFSILSRNYQYHHASYPNLLSRDVINIVKAHLQGTHIYTVIFF